MGDKVPPRFLSKPSIQQEGANIVFVTQIEAAPKPDIKWFRGASPLKSDARHEASVTKEPTSNKYKLSLRIKNVKPEDSDTYKVEAKNAFGQMSANITLNLQCMYYFLKGQYMISTYALRMMLRREYFWHMARGYNIITILATR